MNRHRFGIPALGIAALLGISLSACAGGTGATSSIASTPQQTQQFAPNVRLPEFPIAVSESFNPTSFDGQGGGTSHLTITFTSSVSDAYTYTPLSFSNLLPANLTVEAGESSALVNTCGGQTSVAANLGTFALTNATLKPDGGFCYITFVVSGHMPGTYDNKIPAGAVTTPFNLPSNAATAYVTILPPHIIKSAAKRAR